MLAFPITCQKAPDNMCRHQSQYNPASILFFLFWLIGALAYLLFVCWMIREATLYYVGEGWLPLVSASVLMTLCDIDSFVSCLLLLFVCCFQCNWYFMGSCIFAYLVLLLVYPFAQQNMPNCIKPTKHILFIIHQIWLSIDDLCAGFPIYIV